LSLVEKLIAEIEPYRQKAMQTLSPVEGVAASMVKHSPDNKSQEDEGNPPVKQVRPRIGSLQSPQPGERYFMRIGFQVFDVLIRKVDGGFVEWQMQEGKTGKVTDSTWDRMVESGRVKESPGDPAEVLWQSGATLSNESDAKHEYRKLEDPEKELPSVTDEQGMPSLTKGGADDLKVGDHVIALNTDLTERPGKVTVVRPNSVVVAYDDIYLGKPVAMEYDKQQVRKAAKSGTCANCGEPADTMVLHAEGMAYQPACDACKEDVKGWFGKEFSGFKEFEKDATQRAQEGGPNKLKAPSGDWPNRGGEQLVVGSDSPEVGERYRLSTGAEAEVTNVKPNEQGIMTVYYRGHGSYAGHPGGQMYLKQWKQMLQSNQMEKLSSKELEEVFSPQSPQVPISTLFDGLE
jgi:hypothetical protein